MNQIHVLIDDILLLKDPVVTFNSFSECYELTGRVKNGEWDYLQSDGFEMSIGKFFHQKLQPHDYFIVLQRKYDDYNEAFDSTMPKEKVTLKILKGRLEEETRIKYTKADIYYEDDIPF